MGMEIIPSFFIETMKEIDVEQMEEKFEFYKDDLPHPGSFQAELLQWQVYFIQQLV